MAIRAPDGANNLFDINNNNIDDYPSSSNLTMTPNIRPSFKEHNMLLGKSLLLVTFSIYIVQNQWKEKWKKCLMFNYISSSENCEHA